VIDIFGVVGENALRSEPSLLIEPHLRTGLVFANCREFSKELALTTLGAAPLPLEGGCPVLLMRGHSPHPCCSLGWPASLSLGLRVWASHGSPGPETALSPGHNRVRIRWAEYRLPRRPYSRQFGE
jgi:hypothetical protein